MIVPNGSLPTRNREALLLEYLRHLETRRFGRRLVWLHLSQLEARNRRDQHVRAATSGFLAFEDSGAAQVFVLSDSDVLVFHDAGAGESVRGEVESIMYLFGDDALVAGRDGHLRFATWFDVENDYSGVLLAVREHLMPGLSTDAMETVPARIASRQKSGEPLTPGMLERIESGLAGADLSSLVRQQPVCTVSPQLSVSPQFSELFVSITELRDAVLPHADLHSNPWLFRRLTETLDRRVISYLTRAETVFGGGAISVNVNVSTLLSSAFVALDRGVNGASPSSIAFELQAVDIVSDIGSFLFARGFARQKGFRLLLDGLHWRSIAVLRTDRLGLDLVKVLWDPAFAGRRGDAVSALRGLVERDGADRVVLCRVDDERAVEIGHGLGISLFQGRHIDQLLREDSRRRELSRLKRIDGWDT